MPSPTRELARLRRLRLRPWYLRYPRYLGAFLLFSATVAAVLALTLRPFLDVVRRRGPADPWSILVLLLEASLAVWPLLVLRAWRRFERGRDAVLDRALASAPEAQSLIVREETTPGEWAQLLATRVTRLRRLEASGAPETIVDREHELIRAAVENLTPAQALSLLGASSAALQSVSKFEPRKRWTKKELS